LPKDGISEEAAYHLLTDEITLDAKPTLNLASFVHTSLPEWGERLVDETKYINIVDQDEYPATLQIHGRCISQLADLWHAPQPKDKDGNVQSAFGTACTGSSEAIMLGGLAMKKRWQEKRQKEGKPWKGLGNVVFGSNAQVAIEKFARYFDLEMRLVPTSPESHYRMDPKKAIDMVDEETIGVIVILGSTYTGHYEPVEEMSNLLDDLQKRTGLDVPIHVDGASGAMVAPFATPDLKWDFQIPRVVSINTSGHKFGMTNVGLGWVIFRHPDVVPKELVFELHYLGSVEYSFGLNFSRPANQVLAQAFRFLSLGFSGFQEVMENDLKNARLLSRALEMSGKFDVLSDIHRPISSLAAAGAKAGILDEDSAAYYEAGLPVIAFKFTDDFKKQHPHIKQAWMQTLLRVKGWVVPNYELSPDCDKIEVLRVVVRETMTEDMVSQLVHDVLSIAEDLEDKDSSSSQLALLGQGSGSEAQQKEDKFKHKGKHGNKKHMDLERNAARMDKGTGVKATGYARQC
jgi:glutamate decarboxylase